MSHSTFSPPELDVEMDLDWNMIDAEDVDQGVDMPDDGVHNLDGVTNFDVEMTDAPALEQHNGQLTMTNATALEQYNGQRKGQVKGKGKGQGQGQGKSAGTKNEQAVSCEVEVDVKIVVRINVSTS